MLELIGVFDSFLPLTGRDESSAFGAMSSMAFSTVASGSLASHVEEEEAVDRDEDDQC